MKFDVAAIKKVLSEAGHIVSEGEQMLASDMHELVLWARLHFNLSAEAIHYGMAYPSLLPKDFPGHPDASPATAEAAAAPVEAPQAAPAPQAEQAPVEQTAPVETAAEETAPAVEEKAADEKSAE